MHVCIYIYIYVCVYVHVYKALYGFPPQGPSVDALAILPGLLRNAPHPPSRTLDRRPVESQAAGELQ